MTLSTHELPKSLECFVCGRDNPIGLKLKFKVLGHNTVSAKIKPSSLYNGFRGILHGGVISSMLDDAMDWALYASTGKLYVTSQITVTFKSPGPVEEELEVVATANYDGGKLKKVQTAKAKLLSSTGKLIAEAEGKFFEISEEKSKKLLETFV